MSGFQIKDTLEACILRLKTGDDPEEIVSSYPEKAGELSALLEVAINVRRLTSEAGIPAAAQKRSRAQFLSAAAGMQPAPQKPRYTFMHFRLAISTILGIGILAAILLGSGWASAAALPGDIFYPVKLRVEQMQISVVQDPPAQLALQETYDSRRQQEAEQLSQMDRRQPVTFGGFLEKTEANQWQVGNVALALPANFPPPTSLIGTYVEVSGYSNDKVVEVQDIQARQLQWSGILQKFDDQTWLIGGVTLTINEETQLTGGKPQVGTSVQVTAIRQSENQFLALNLDVSDKANIANGSEGISALTLTPQPLKMATVRVSQGKEAATAGTQLAGQPVQRVVITASTPIRNSPSKVENTSIPKPGVIGMDNEPDEAKSTPIPQHSLNR